MVDLSVDLMMLLSSFGMTILSLINGIEINNDTDGFKFFRSRLYLHMMYDTYIHYHNFNLLNLLNYFLIVVNLSLTSKSS